MNHLVAEWVTQGGCISLYSRFESETRYPFCGWHRKERHRSPLAWLRSATSEELSEQ
jgi:hypothetical protein